MKEHLDIDDIINNVSLVRENLAEKPIFGGLYLKYYRSEKQPNLLEMFHDVVWNYFTLLFLIIPPSRIINRQIHFKEDDAF